MRRIRIKRNQIRFIPPGVELSLHPQVHIFMRRKRLSLPASPPFPSFPYSTSALSYRLNINLQTYTLVRVSWPPVLSSPSALPYPVLVMHSISIDGACALLPTPNSNSHHTYRPVFFDRGSHPLSHIRTAFISRCQQSQITSTATYYRYLASFLLLPISSSPSPSASSSSNLATHKKGMNPSPTHAH